MLVASGAANRVDLANVRSRPGLLWEAEKIARDEGVEVVVVTTRATGTVDLRISPLQCVADDAAEERSEEGG